MQSKEIKQDIVGDWKGGVTGVGPCPEIYVLLFSIELGVARMRNWAHERAKIKYTAPCTQAAHACVLRIGVCVCVNVTMAVCVCVCVSASEQHN